MSLSFPKLRRALFIATLTTATLTPAVALADAASIAQGKERFLAGAQAYREGRYADAIDLFRQANGLDPHPEMLFNIGQAYEKLGDPANALSVYRQYLRTAGAAPDRANVETMVKNLEQRLQERGLHQVTVQSTPSGAKVDLDGKPVGTTPWTGDISAGRHVFVLHAEGYPDVARELVTSGDKAVSLDVLIGSFAPPPPVSQGPAPPPPPPEPAPAPRRSVSALTIVTLGVGLAGLGTAIGLEVARANADTSAKNNPTQVGYANALSTMTTDQTAARVVVGLASAVTVAGIVLLAVDLRRAPAPSPGAPTASSPTVPTTALRFGCFTSTCGTFVRGEF